MKTSTFDLGGNIVYYCAECGRLTYNYMGICSQCLALIANDKKSD